MCARRPGKGPRTYLSPQSAQGEQDDTRGDIYSLGAVLYELLTGKPPYSAGSREEIIRQIHAGPPPPVTELNPRLRRPWPKSPPRRWPANCGIATRTFPIWSKI